MTKKHNSNIKKTSNKENQVNEPIPTENPLEVLDREVHAPDSYIIRSDEANKPVENNFSFFSRVWSIPLIHDTTIKAQEIANRYTISRFAMQKAEAAANLALHLASPYAEHYKAQLMKADKFGCRSLDLVESKIPPSTLLSNPQKAYKDVKGRIMNYTNENVEQLVDKYLPKENNDERLRSSSKDHKQSLANEIKDRLTYRVKTDFSRLVENHQILQGAYQSIQKAGVRLEDILNSLKAGHTSTHAKAN
ncbi:hypothetical protein G6F57_003301 [Rhizopus arrhizus]|uniref:Uncharacterized protein n=1 Tax=Rhizopus oryzae TaxID=64495 RepID=A0A9P6WZ39_RHIOR|nr:hypothetical protein G6F24_011654 [Rhizopus arrhizus]KAG0782027.1 hypothetical protein G6F21_011334 [Rhizopus arrhizus]KAG0815560.1 hypothetical protein G6F20_003900 [Rhizopus arrhizus]KAG0823110.1 hypothetical protein G6F18_011460 [Rhizopus arrhizus]KAG0830883.1 hypothetical protein G6F19_007015 [Rhizopus arrhizus]